MEDEITAPIRRRVSKWAEGHEEFSFRERVDFALNCHACASVYTSAVAVLASRFRVGRVLLRVLALSEASLLGKAVVDKLEA